jgi:hypothetical protein
MVSVEQLSKRRDIRRVKYKKNYLMDHGCVSRTTQLPSVQRVRKDVAVSAGHSDDLMMSKSDNHVTFCVDCKKKRHHNTMTKCTTPELLYYSRWNYLSDHSRSGPFRQVWYVCMILRAQSSHHLADITVSNERKPRLW